MKKTSDTLMHLPFKMEKSNDGLEIISLDDFLASGKTHLFETPHLLKFYAILFIEDGNGIHEIDFVDYPYKGNTIVFIKKSQVHAWKKCTDVNGYLILFTEEFLQNNQVRFKELSYSYPYNTFLHEPLLVLENKQNIRSFQLLVSTLHEEYLMANSPEKPEILQCLLRTFLLKVQNKKPKVYSKLKTGHKMLFIKLQKMLTEKIAESRNVIDYCKWLNVSYQTLNETCKALTKNTVKAFIDNFIILQAKQMLTHTDLTIGQISYKLSFEEPTNFTKFFKKHTRLAPKEFQRSIFTD